MSIDYSMPDSAWRFEFQIEGKHYLFGEIENIPSVGVQSDTGRWEPLYHAHLRPMDWVHIRLEGELVHAGRTFFEGNAIDESDCMYAYLRKILFLISRQLTIRHPRANDEIDDIPMTDWAVRIAEIVGGVKHNGSTLTV